MLIFSETFLFNIGLQWLFLNFATPRKIYMIGHRGHSWEKQLSQMFYNIGVLKVSKNSQKSTCPVASFLYKIVQKQPAQVFCNLLVEINFKDHLFWRTSSSSCFCLQAPSLQLFQKRDSDTELLTKFFQLKCQLTMVNSQTQFISNKRKI